MRVDHTWELVASDASPYSTTRRKLALMCVALGDPAGKRARSARQSIYFQRHRTSSVLISVSSTSSGAGPLRQRCQNGMIEALAPMSCYYVVQSPNACVHGGELRRHFTFLRRSMAEHGLAAHAHLAKLHVNTSNKGATRRKLVTRVSRPSWKTHPRTKTECRHMKNHLPQRPNMLKRQTPEIHLYIRLCCRWDLDRRWDPLINAQRATYSP